MSDKVRYYLEQSVPELEDLKVKGLFDKNEITMIMRRRTDFEHRITGRGSRPRDYIKYSEFEQNLEKLRKKRYNRLKEFIDTKPSLSDWAGVRRIMFILDRGTKKFPGDIQLWNTYLKFAKQNGAIKAIYKIYSRLLQLQPRNIDAWLSAAKYEFETNGNAKGTRLLFQRGLRLNPESEKLWLNYAQFELTYIAKLLARKELGKILQVEHEMELPEAPDIEELPDVEEASPALRGDIVLAIFEACIEKLGLGETEKFLDVIDQFDMDKNYLYSNILKYIQENYPDDIRTKYIDTTLPLRYNDIQLAVNKCLAYNDKELTNMFINKLRQIKGNEKIESIIQSIIRKLN
ncbi:UTP6 [Candida pseudojiufengensis]|uniref:UTP6 n=1 Tax=Candida pseudojiufengensis TaxID=497109 RepID=UPI002223F7C6|nr:UTP6 [Candida pseudojiufengensis]KAI5960166.1 UTP6 [Candida pseudojiufengensis]